MKFKSPRMRNFYAISFTHNAFMMAIKEWPCFHFQYPPCLIRHGPRGRGISPAGPRLRRGRLPRTREICFLPSPALHGGNLKLKVGVVSAQGLDLDRHLLTILHDTDTDMRHVPVRAVGEVFDLKRHGLFFRLQLPDLKAAVVTE